MRIKIKRLLWASFLFLLAGFFPVVAKAESIKSTALSRDTKASVVLVKDHDRHDRGRGRWDRDRDDWRRGRGDRDWRRGDWDDRWRNNNRRDYYYYGRRYYYPNYGYYGYPYYYNYNPYPYNYNYGYPYNGRGSILGGILRLW